MAIGPRFPAVRVERHIGTDETEARFAKVTLDACTICNALWLRYQVEHESVSGSGRWATALIPGETALDIKPEQAATYITSQPWYVYGGSHWGHGGKRREGGELRWG